MSNHTEHILPGGHAQAWGEVVEADPGTNVQHNKPHTSGNVPPWRILVVDDNQDSNQTMGWMLEMLGHQVQLAGSAAEALNQAKSFKPDIAFLDISMPEMNGYALCRALQKLDTLRDCMFVAQTGWTGKNHAQQSKEAGFHHHLVKPVAMDKIERLLEEIGKKIVIKKSGIPA